MVSINRDSNDEDTKPMVKDLIDPSQNSDPSVNIATLPENHPIHLLEEARQFYRGQRPPFVLRKRAESKRNVVIPTASGRRPIVPTRVEVVARSWDDKSMLWTLDLNNIRYIVKPFGGAPQAGAKYLYWAGPSKGFEQKPLAFTELNPRPFHDIQPQMEDSWDESDSIESSPGGTPAVSRRLAASAVPGEGSLGHRTPALNDRWFANFTARIPTDSGLALGPTGDDPDSEAARNKIRKGKSSITHSNLPRQEVVDLDESTSSQNTPRKRRKTDISRREIARLQDRSPPKPNNANGTKQDVLPIWSRPSPEISESWINQPAKSRTSMATSPTDGSIDPAVLPQYKRNRTTLIVRVAPSAVFQPMEFADCPNAWSLYIRVLGIWDIRITEDPSLMVTFSWMAVDDRMRTMAFDRGNRFSFTYLLERIVECPCWADDKGKCIIDVDIVPKVH